LLTTTRPLGVAAPGVPGAPLRAAVPDTRGTASDRARLVVLDALAEGPLLWPLLPCHPCRLCAIPRRPARAWEFRTCYRCRELRALYGDALDGLHPLSLTTRDWPLGSALRHFKDDLGAAPDTDCARMLGAALSAYLQARVSTASPFGLPHGPSLITAVPSSRPAVTAGLVRAAREGWWTPPLPTVAVARPGLPRQRERSGRERLHVEGKWDVDDRAVRGHDVLVLDDLYTTGGTVHSFALALRTAGARSVHAAVLALNVADSAGWILPALRTRHHAGVRWSPAPTLRERYPR
jgi:predicted amidophosphoribosyltransferase